MKLKSILCFVAILLIASVGCNRKSVFVQSSLEQNRTTNNELDNLAQVVYLIGDAGGEVEGSASNFKLLKAELDKSDQENTSVVFLGDNIYASGLHEESHPLRAEDEKRIDAQIDIVKDFKGNITFIPGNHDWQKGGKDGFQFIKRQEDYIQDKLGKVFDPSDGCPGPKDIEISKELSLIIIDTQWWLHQYKKGRGEQEDCN